MKLIFSNHYEALEAALLDDLAITPQDPFAPQHIVIPSLAIRRRLELGIANRFGVCANLNCDYLAQWLWQQIGAFVPVPAVSPFAPSLLVWRLNRLLSGPTLPGADRLNAYLSRADEVMRFELAERITKLFDHYLTYRPEWLAAWSEGRSADIGSSQAAHLQDAAWQAELWRQIIGELGLNPFHPAADFFETAAHLEPDDPRLASLPKAAFVFCLPTMPPLYIRLLEHLSRWIDLRLYLINPCHQYWFEIVDARRLSYLTQRGQEAYHETGNQLLASWGKQTQAHIDLLLGETTAEVVVDDSRFARNNSPTMLATLQNAILNLEPLTPVTPSVDDQSIAIHACHHLTRQLEVLHDQLLALFNGTNPPTPADVLVVTPDLGEAAPMIDAVFGTVPVERRIPYTITGRPATQENTIARVLLQLLVLPQGRFTASEVFQLLQESPIARRFNLQADEQHSIQRWLKQSGIRWGFDADHHLDCGFAKSGRHTFAEGLQRLFLGYALPDGDEYLVSGLLPCPVGEGSQAQALGRFWLFVDSLRSLRYDLNQTRTPDAWQRTLLTLTNTFFDPDDDSLDQLKIVRAAIADLCTEAMASSQSMLLSDKDTDTKIPLAVLRLALQERLDDPARGGVPCGRVTFAAMSSLRGLPYRVICLLGMDDGAYPSATKPVEFDLMSIAPKRGDLQRKNDERNVFLDLLLATRDRLIITYSGRNIHDNAPLPPSVLVSELLDHLLPAIAGQADDKSLRAARERLVVEHPLQAFSSRYFKQETPARSWPTPATDSSRLFSFDTDYCEAARLTASKTTMTTQVYTNGVDNDENEPPTERQSSFFVRPLAPPDIAWQAVSLQQLLHFFRNPCRYLLCERLGLKLATSETELMDDEPFTLDWESWRSVSERLLPLMLHDEDQGQIERLAAAGHEFPDGKPGALLQRRELSRLHQFATVVREATTDISPEPLPFSFDFDLDGEAWKLTGSLTGLSPEGLLRYRCDDTRATDYLATWLSHLALCTLLPPGVATNSRCLSLNGEFTINPVDNATEIFKELLSCYRQGLSQVLHFFPKSAWAYITSGGNKQKAYACWQCTAQRPHGEAADPYYRLALRGEDDPLAGNFATLAQTIYGPLRLHLEDSRLQ
jgi:exodeoxyribonuclease V gamma subunit